MPKVSSQNLVKRFKCEQCDASFRTRQGLSGHIQFKHKNKQQSPDFQKPQNILLKAQELKALHEAAGLSESDSQARAYILLNWTTVLTECDLLDINLNNQDFKNYLITSYALLFQNEQLENRLIKGFASLLEEYKQHDLP